MKRLRGNSPVSLSEKSGRRRFYLIYSMAFWAMALGTFIVFILSDYSLIWGTDGWQQHFKALCYYAAYLRGILCTLLREHRLVIPNWEYALGEGSDILNTLHYYVMGDPIALLSVAVPLKWMHLFYSFSCVLRLYLAGLAFVTLALGTGKRSPSGILAGALSYCFSMWCLYSVARHPSFLNQLIWFPLLILGIEKILRKERPYCFILAACLSAVSNFYFFYMIAILGVLYALVRLLLLRELNWKEKLLALVRMGLYALLGVCMAGTILLPVLLMFLGDSRAAVAQPFHLFYHLSYYAALPGATLSVSRQYWYCGGYTAPLVLAAAALFVRKGQSRLLKIFCILCGIFLIFPVFGRFFNGMGYMTNRWSWVMSLLGAYILADQWEGLFALSGRERGKLLAFSLVILGWAILSDKSRTDCTLAVCCLLFVTLIIAGTGASGRKKGLTPRRAMVLLTACNILVLSLWFYAPGLGNYIGQCVDNEAVERLSQSTDALAIRELSDGGAVRFSGRDMSRNENLMAGLSSTEYYWSNSNSWLNRYRTELEINETMFSRTEGYDGRTVPLALAGVRYFCVLGTDKAPLPYGFSKKEIRELFEDEIIARQEQLRRSLGAEALTEDQAKKIEKALTTKIGVSRNKNPMPLGYCYSTRLTRQAWEGMDALQRQQIQLDAVCLEDPTGGEVRSVLPEYGVSPADYDLPVEITCLSSEVTPTEDGFLVTAPKASIQLTFAGLPNAETYLRAEGFSFLPVARADLYGGDRSVDPLNLYNDVNWELLTPADRVNLRKQKLYQLPSYRLSIGLISSGGVSKTLKELSADAGFSAGRTDFLVCMGYQKEAVSSITLSFPEVGRYSFRKLGVCAVSMEGFEEKLAALRQDSPKDLRLDVDEITCSIRLEEPKVLVLAVPYAKGWRAEVDGAPAKLLLANGRYLGMELPAGEHSIVLRYTTPFLHLGMTASGLGLLAFFLLVLLTERRRKRRAAPAEDSAREQTQAAPETQAPCETEGQTQREDADQASDPGKGTL